MIVLHLWQMFICDDCLQSTCLHISFDDHFPGELGLSGFVLIMIFAISKRECVMLIFTGMMPHLSPSNGI